MATARMELRGHRGWVTIVLLALVLAAIVGTQARSSVANADLSPVATTTPSSPSVAGPVASDAAPAVVEAAEAAVTTPTAVPAAAPAKQVSPRLAAPAADVCAGPGWQAKRGQRALASLRDSGQRSGVTVAFKGAQSGYLGLTYPAQRRVEVFVRSCSTESATLLRHVISHEMGHAFDAAHMTPATRAAYMAMRGIPAGTPWFGCNYCSDFATPAGDFAETYSQWQRGSSDSRTKMAAMPNPVALAAVAAAFFQV